VYAVGALATAAPGVAILVFAAASRSPRRLLDLAIGMLFNPMLMGSLGLAAWYGSIAWRSISGAVVARAEVRCAELLAVLLGASLACMGGLAIDANHASAARGGGLLGGLGELTLIVGVAYVLLAACSWVAAAFCAAAPCDTDPHPLAPPALARSSAQAPRTRRARSSSR